MIISVKGKNSKLSKNEVRNATKFYASKLLKPNKINDLDITIGFKDMQYEAIVFALEEYGKYPTIFKININETMGKRKQLLALAHEMVHVKQYTTGELKQKNANWIWNNEEINKSLDYWEYPHEIDAHGRELGLYLKYITS